MALINLPSLVQKIKVDTSEMKKAEADATAFGSTLKTQGKESDSALQALQKRQAAFADSTKAMSAEVQNSTKDFKEETKSLTDNSVAVQDVDKSVNKLTSSIKETKQEYAGFNTTAADTKRVIDDIKKSFDEETASSDKSRDSHKKHNSDTSGLANGFTKLSKEIAGAGKSFGGLGVDISAVKIPLIAAGLSAGVGATSALTAGVGALVAQFGPMVGQVGLLVPGMLAFKVNTMLLSDAFKLLKKEDPTGTFKLLKKIQEDTAKATAAQLVPGLKAINPLVKSMGVEWKQVGKDIGASVSGQLVAISKLPSTVQSSWKLALGDVGKIGVEASKGISPLFVILGQFINATAPFLIKDIKDMVGGLSKFADSAGKTNSVFSKTWDFMKKADEVSRSFIKSLVNLGVAIHNVFSLGAKSVGIDFVGGLEQGTKKMREFTESVKGKNEIKSFFADAGPTIKELGLLLKDVVKDLLAFGKNESLSPFIKQLRTEVLPSFDALGQGAGKNLLPILGHVVQAFADFNNILAFSPLLETIDSFAKMTSEVAKIVGEVPGLGKFVATILLLKTAGKGLGIVSNLTGITGLVKSLGSIGEAGKAGATGIGGFVQGLRGATTEGATFSNKIGGLLKTAFTGGIESVKTLGGALATGLKSGASAAATALSSVTTGTKNMVAALATNSKGAIVALGGTLKTVAANAVEAGKQMALVAGASIKTAWGSLVGALTPVANGLKVAAGAAKAFTVSLLTNPVFLIAAAIIALGVALVELFKHNKTFHDFVITAWNKIKEVIGVVVDWLVNTAWPWIKQVWDNIVKGVEAIWPAVQAAWKVIQQVIETYIKVIIEIIKTEWGLVKTFIIDPIVAVVGFIIDHWETIKNTFNTAINIIIGIVKTQFEIIKTLVIDPITAIVQFITDHWETIKLVFSTALQFIATVFKTQFDIIKTLVTTWWGVVSNIFSTAIGVIKTVVQAGWDFIKNIFSTVLAVIKAVLTGHFSDIPKIIETGFNNAKKIVSDAWNTMKTIVTTGVGNVITLVKELPGKIVSAIGDLGSLLYNAGKKVIQGLIDGIASMLGSLGSIAGRAAGAIAGLFPHSPVKEGPLKILNRGAAGKKIIQMVVDGMNQGAKNINATGLSNLIPTPRPGSVASVSRFPSAPMVGQQTGSGNVDNSRTYNVQITETTGPSSASSITDRLRLLDVTLP